MSSFYVLHCIDHDQFSAWYCLSRRIGAHIEAQRAVSLIESIFLDPQCPHPQYDANKRGVFMPVTV